MRLEPANIICPKCGNGNYMRHLIGKNVGKLDMKCINCNSYFNFDELYKQKIAEVVKPLTHADSIRAMTDEELAAFLTEYRCVHKAPHCREADCTQCWLDWLKSPASEVSDGR